MPRQDIHDMGPDTSRRHAVDLAAQQSRNVAERYTAIAKHIAAICRDLWTHPTVKGQLLEGKTHAWIATNHHLHRRTVSSIAAAPFTALETVDDLPINLNGLIDEVWYHNQPDYSPLITPRGALVACMAYDLTHFPNPGPEVLAARYRLSQLDILHHLQRAYAFRVLNERTDPDPGRDPERIEQCARSLGCDDEQIIQAKREISDWLSTPVVPEIGNRIYTTTRRDYPDSPRLDARLSAQRSARENAELAAYGSFRATVEDADGDPAGLARDLLLSIEGKNSEMDLVDGRTEAVRKFADSLDLPVSGYDTGHDPSRNLPDPQDVGAWEALIDQSLYDAHQVHLPHIALAAESGTCRPCGGYLPGPAGETIGE
jgi:hypothetical protein